MSLLENKKATILVVDDDKSNIDLILNILPHYDLITCLDGKTALKMVQQEDIDLILLDVVMPEMDGYEVCSILKVNPDFSNIPVMFLSAKDSIENINKGFNLGAVDYVTKPFNPTELKSRIKTHLQLQNFQKSLEKKNEELDKLNNKIKEVVKKDMEDMYAHCDYFGGEDIDIEQYLNNISIDED